MRFCNRYLEDWEQVHRIPPLGYENEKKTLAMPPPMHEALKKDVVKRVRDLRPPENKDYAPEAAVKIAKYLGK